MTANEMACWIAYFQVQSELAQEQEIARKQAQSRDEIEQLMARQAQQSG